MNGRCDVCGCKTEREQLKEYVLSGEKREVCVFCKKQLDLIAKNPVENSASAINMLSRDTKGNRTPETQSLLEKQFSDLGVGITDNTGTAVSGNTQSAEVEELKKRVEELSNELKAFKKGYLFSKILSIVLPIVFVVIMLIVLIASGALKNIFGYYDYLSELANM
jgi:polyhydroxyalkanoate synthesis regulator phasin